MVKIKKPARRKERRQESKGVEMERKKTESRTGKLRRAVRLVRLYSPRIRSMRKGSAFILVVMLVTLLSLIGAMFLLRSRVERMSATAITQNQELTNAADTVVAAISQQLVLDTPGVNSNAEYYDYPDPCDAWLSNLEPYLDTGDGLYKWRQISDVTGYLNLRTFLTQNVPVDLTGSGTYIDEKQETGTNLWDFRVIADGTLQESWADADGDGIADSKWIELKDVVTNSPFITTSRGEPVYAAVRVVDNGGMLNVNTAKKFTPYGYDVDANKIDGTSQMHIDLLALSKRGANPSAEQRLDDIYRNPNQLNTYERDVVWGYGMPTTSFTPFDISDELKLRNRNLLHLNGVITRIERLWTKAYDGGLEVPVQRDPNDPKGPFDDWVMRAKLKPDKIDDYSVWLNSLDWKTYDFRHISTTYNIDRIINPFGERMINIQNVPENVPENDNTWAQNLYNDYLMPCMKDIPAGLLYNTMQAEFAQIAANIKDYSDNDTKVTTVRDNFGKGNPHYGYERPDIRISEIVYADRYVNPKKLDATYDPCSKDPNRNDPNYLHRSYAIEISNDFRESDDVNGWRFIIDTPIQTGFTTNFHFELILTQADFDARGGRYFVAVFEDPCASISQLVKWLDSPADGARGVDPNVILRWDDIWGRDINGNWIKSNRYDVYFCPVQAPYTEQEVQKMIADANSYLPIGGVYKGRQDVNWFKPPSMDLNTKYYWRIAGVNDLDHILNNKDDVMIDDGKPAWKFTTWMQKPQIVFDSNLSPKSPPVFDSNSTVILKRLVPNKMTNNGYLIVDILGPTGSLDDKIIPNWLVETFNANKIRRDRSFQRDLTWQGRLRRLWNYDYNPLDPNNLLITQPTLGWSNPFNWQAWTGIELPKLQSQNWRLNNIGELGNIFKKSAYYEVSNLSERIQVLDTEYDGPGILRGIKVDLREPAFQNMFKYLTVMDPIYHVSDACEVRVQGRININTAPWFVLAQLPWVSGGCSCTGVTDPYALAKAIVAYRDKDAVPPGGPDYSNKTVFGTPGFENIGQLNNVYLGKGNVDPWPQMQLPPWRPPPGDYSTSIESYGLDGRDQRGFPDLSTSRDLKLDGSADDQEERDLIFARISDLVTVRSDVFTAYFLVRLGQDGPQKRFMAILDRSDVRNVGGKIVGNVKIRSLYEVPDRDK